MVKFNFADFLKAHLGEKQGEILEFETKKVLGAHPGYWFYTIGQRQGLGLSGGPWYVVSKNVEKNIVYVSKTYDAVSEHKHGMVVTDFNWNQGVLPEKSDLNVRFRHGPALYPCSVTTFSDSSFCVKTIQDKCDNLFFKIMLKHDSKQGIAAGQFAVLYDGDVCLGGGVIEQAL